MAEVSVLIVGGGPAGLSAAVQARELDATVTVLEAEQIGGTSLNRGPAPVRTLARAARLVRDWASWERFGLEGPPPVPNLEAVLAHSTEVARYAHDKKDIAGHMRQSGIELVERLGHVFFSGPDTLEADDGRQWQADRIVIAVGGHPAPLPVPGGELALTYNDIRGLKALPQRVAVVGGADTGCQMASIFDDFGVKVLLVETAPVIVPTADASVSYGLQEAFEARGMDVLTSARVEALETSGGEFLITISRGGSIEQLQVDAVFAAVGWPARLEELRPAAAGISHDRQSIPVDAHLRTNVEHIFAAGDVNGRSKLVQSARPRAGWRPGTPFGGRIAK